MAADFSGIDDRFSAGMLDRALEPFSRILYVCRDLVGGAPGFSVAAKQARVVGEQAVERPPMIGMAVYVGIGKCPVREPVQALLDRGRAGFPHADMNDASAHGCYPPCRLNFAS